MISARIYHRFYPKISLDYLKKAKRAFRFINDAAAFTMGSCQHLGKGNITEIIGLTFGTGLGACFLNKGIPLTDDPDVPCSGNLWDKNFEEGIADDYFSTRWFLF